MPSPRSRLKRVRFSSPAAHIVMLEEEIVTQREWLSQATYKLEAKSTGFDR